MRRQCQWISPHQLGQVSTKRSFWSTARERLFLEQPTSTSILITSQSVRLAGFSSSVTLIPISASNLSFSLEYRRSQDLFFTSRIESNCNNALSTHFQWSLNNCALSNCLDAFPLDPTLLATITTKELDIAARTLPSGISERKYSVPMNLSSNFTTKKLAFVRITSFGITGNLVSLGTSMISSGSEGDLQLYPGLYSLDPDENQFNASDRNYQYFCWIYGMSNFPSLYGSLLPIDGPLVDSHNPSCLNNRSGRAADLLLFHVFISSSSEVNGASSSRGDSPVCLNRWNRLWFSLMLRFTPISRTNGWFTLRINEVVLSKERDLFFSESKKLLPNQSPLGKENSLTNRFVISSSL